MKRTCLILCFVCLSANAQLVSTDSMVMSRVKTLFAATGRDPAKELEAYVSATSEDGKTISVTWLRPLDFAPTTQQVASASYYVSPQAAALAKADTEERSAAYTNLFGRLAAVRAGLTNATAAVSRKALTDLLDGIGAQERARLAREEARK